MDGQGASSEGEQSLAHACLRPRTPQMVGLPGAPGVTCAPGIPGIPGAPGSPDTLGTPGMPQEGA